MKYRGFEITIGPSRNPGRSYEHVARVFRGREPIGEARALSSRQAIAAAKRRIDEYTANGEEEWPA